MLIFLFRIYNLRCVLVRDEKKTNKNSAKKNAECFLFLIVRIFCVPNIKV